MSPNQAYLNLKEAAEYLGIPYPTATVSWPSWEKNGVVPSRRNGRRTGILMFKRKDLDALVDSWRVA